MALTKDQKLEIDGSGLFFFKTYLKEERQLEILKWYQSLTDKERGYIDDLRDELKDETNFFNATDVSN